MYRGGGNTCVYVGTVVNRTRVSNRVSKPVMSSIVFSDTGASNATRAKCGAKGGRQHVGGEALLADAKR